MSDYASVRESNIQIHKCTNYKSMNIRMGVRLHGCANERKCGYTNLRVFK